MFMVVRVFSHVHVCFLHVHASNHVRWCLSMFKEVHVFHGHGGSWFPWSWWFMCFKHVICCFLFNMCIVGHCFIICHGGSCFYTSWWFIC